MLVILSKTLVSRYSAILHREKASWAPAPTPEVCCMSPFPRFSLILLTVTPKDKPSEDAQSKAPAEKIVKKDSTPPVAVNKEPRGLPNKPTSFGEPTNTNGTPFAEKIQK